MQPAPCSTDYRHDAHNAIHLPCGHSYCDVCFEDKYLASITKGNDNFKKDYPAFKNLSKSGEFHCTALDLGGLSIDDIDDIDDIDKLCGKVIDLNFISNWKWNDILGEKISIALSINTMEKEKMIQCPTCTIWTKPPNQVLRVRCRQCYPKFKTDFCAVCGYKWRVSDSQTLCGNDNCPNNDNSSSTKIKTVQTAPDQNFNLAGQGTIKVPSVRLCPECDIIIHKTIEVKCKHMICYNCKAECQKKRERIILDFAGCA